MVVFFEHNWGTSLGTGTRNRDAFRSTALRHAAHLGDEVFNMLGAALMPGAFGLMRLGTSLDAGVCVCNPWSHRDPFGF